MKLILWILCGALAGLAFFLKFCVPGYSFSALVCICIVAVILFYTLMPMIGVKWPLLSKWATRVFTVVLAIGLLVVLFWKGKGYWRREVFVKNNPMTVGSFFSLVCVFLSAQFFFQMFSLALEWLLNQIGFSAMAAVEMASTTGSTFSMYIYVCFLGPIAEELLFRGIVLRTLRPWGKQAAILISALVFGLFHGNVVQIPFAFFAVRRLWDDRAADRADCMALARDSAESVKKTWAPSYLGSGKWF